MKHFILRAFLGVCAGAVLFLLADVASAQVQLGDSGNCGIVKSRTTACLFQSSLNPGGNVSDDVKPIKTGKACMFNVLRLVALGDASIETAARNGGITKIANADSEAFEVIPGWGVYKIYGQWCTIVRGE